MIDPRITLIFLKYTEVTDDMFKDLLDIYGDTQTVYQWILDNVPSWSRCPTVKYGLHYSGKLY